MPSSECSPVRALQRVSLEKALDFSQSDALVGSTPWAAQMLVKVGYAKEVLTDGPSTEAMLKQPVAEPLHKLP